MRQFQECPFYAGSSVSEMSDFKLLYTGMPINTGFAELCIEVENSLYILSIHGNIDKYWV